MCREADAEEFEKERKSLMDSMDVKVIKSGFSAVNAGLKAAGSPDRCCGA